MHDGAHVAIVQAHGDFQAGLVRGIRFDALAGHAACDGAEDAGRDGAFAATDCRAGHAAQRRACQHARARFALVDGHLAYGFNRTHADRLFILRLARVVDICRVRLYGAAGQGGEQCHCNNWCFHVGLPWTKVGCRLRRPADDDLS
ncbi:hypothetical protein D3C81_1616180 [compost metagenome]